MAEEPRERLQEIFGACLDGNTLEVTRILQCCDVAFLVNGRNPYDYQQTPLLVASRKGHVEVVTILVEHGPDAKAVCVDSQGNEKTARSEASWRCHDEVLKILLEHGADVNGMCMGTEGSALTALFEASIEGYEEAVKILVEHGANVSGR